MKKLFISRIFFVLCIVAVIAFLTYINFSAAQTSEKLKAYEPVPAQTLTPVMLTAELNAESSLESIAWPEPAEPSTAREEAPEPVMTYLGEYQIYGYTPTCAHCCGKTDEITASGVKATIGQTVAMKGYPFGTQLYIEGLGYFTVEDRGVGNGFIDVACVDHKACYTITGHYDVYLIEQEESAK